MITGRSIYFVRPVGMDGPVKIGCSKEPLRRALQLSIWCPFKLEVVHSMPGTLADERALHRHFSADLLHNEWFKPSDRLCALIGKLVAGAALVDLIVKALAAIGSAKPKRSTSRRRYASYGARIRNTEKKLRKLGENTAWWAPRDAAAIMSAWGRSAPDVFPTDAEIGRLDEYLADPGAHSEIPPWVKAQPSVVEGRAA